ncbi:MAG TPA: tetratricopeptide repeat protein [Thermoanaerobaculia bacterium]|jgi:tetratricopeptide (TPR) repeat protein|nr:tetratricopeptide repeat protein [Thermoanaerobaculia bacterium]
MEPRELDDELYGRIMALTDSGNARSDAGRHREALADFESALALIPEPIEDWEASTWVLTALGDCCFLLGDYEGALGHLERALDCPDIPGSEFLMLRLGQVLYETGDEAGAKEVLAQAWKIGGKELFEGEDGKYLALARS